MNACGILIKPDVVALRALPCRRSARAPLVQATFYKYTGAFMNTLRSGILIKPDVVALRALPCRRSARAPLVQATFYKYTGAFMNTLRSPHKRTT